MDADRDAAVSEPPRVRQVVVAASVGNGLEWFDFAAYGLLATTLAKVFFPEEVPAAALLSTLGIFGVAFLVRPVAAFVLGRAADRHGRRRVLILTIGLMSAATLAISLLPTYDEVGVLAPVLLLLARVCQGVAVGAEWGVSAAFMTEWAPRTRSGRLSSSLGMTVALGTLAASVLIAALSAASETWLVQWGWRIPFLLGGVVGLAGLVARYRLPETPVYEGHTRLDPTVPVPPLGRRALLLVGIVAYWSVIFYVVLTYVPTFVQAHGSLTTSQALTANSIGLAVLVVLVPVAGRVSDRVGRTTLAIVSAAWTVVVSVPLVIVLERATVTVLVGALVVWSVALAVNGAIAPVLAASLFPAQVRSVWVATTYAVTVAVLGGTAPYVCEWLVQTTGSATAFAWVLVAFAAIGLCASVLVRRVPTFTVG